MVQMSNFGFRLFGRRGTSAVQWSSEVLSKRQFSSYGAHFRQISRDHERKIEELERSIVDDFETIRQNYATPKYPVVLAHGLCGFDEIRVAGTLVPAVYYWRGITKAMSVNGINVITTSVPPFGSIEERAACLGEQIAERANGKSVNIIAHSMGGLDARYMVSKLQPKNLNVLSLTTVGTPHCGSTFADAIFEVGAYCIPLICNLLGRAGISTGAFNQLTQKYMTEEFNPKTPDVPGVHYYSYGATINPSMLSMFRLSHKIINAREGSNDGLVSVNSAKWGHYQGTLVGVTHLDLINWTNQLRYLTLQMQGSSRKFNAIAFYLGITDMLAKQGL